MITNSAWRCKGGASPVRMVLWNQKDFIDYQKSGLEAEHAGNWQDPQKSELEGLPRIT